MFEKFTFWLNTDPNSKKKILLVIAGILVLSSLSIGLFFLNNQRTQPNTSTLTPVAITTTEEVNQPTFDTASNLRQISNTQLGLPQRVGFTAPNNSPFFVDQDFKLVVNNLPVPNSPVFLPKTYSSDKNNLIINEDFQTTLYIESSKQFLPLNTDVTFLTKINEGEFLFVSNLEGKLNIRKTNNIGRTNSSTEFAVVTPQIQFQTYELRVFAGQVFVFVFSDFYRNENAEIWSVTAGNSTKILSINSLSSTKFSETGFLYTQNLGTSSFSTNYLDLSSQTPSTPIAIDFTNLLTDNRILGQIIAERCSINRDKVIDCLVKEKTTDWEFFKNKDILVKLDPRSRIVSFPNRDIIFSGESLTHAPDGSLYLVSQELRQLYKFEI